MKNKLNTSLTLLTVLGLTACAGGGGGGGEAGPTPFSSWSSVSPNSKVNLTGGSSTITNTGSFTQSAGGASAQVTFDGNRQVTAMTLNSAAGNSASFNSSNGDTIANGLNGTVVVALNKSQTSAAIITNPYTFGFEYQTYGAWGGYGSAGTSTSNAFSVGSPTPISGMPASGTAVFVGNSGGIAADTSGNAYIYSSSMAASVNFGSRQINYATSGSLASGPATGNAVVSAPGLNMTGTMSYGAGANSFSGSVRAANGTSGPISGQFYGPNANEIGGTYATAGPAGVVIGGFGGKR